MAIDILFFGSLVDITETPKIQIADLPDTEAVIDFLQIQFPALKNKTYFFSVNKQIVHNNQVVKQGDSIALMPPFSGG
jgi:molybdopterin converting factor small subunit